ncbi:MAG: transposase, partial [Hadesarchaea archaeon]|nr:transposase [Hadesarchaea archaeon]
REVEWQAPSFMGRTIDHSTVGKAFKRLRRNYLKLLIVLLRREITKLVKCELYIVDSTGISTPRLRRRRKAFKTLWEHEHLKLHALVGYSRRAGALVVAAAEVTRNNVADCTQLKQLLEGFYGQGEPLLGDTAYDSRRNFELVREHGFKPIIKLRSIEPHGFVRRQAVREFKRQRKLYRQRGIGEAFFAGLANRYGSRTRCKIAKT